MRDPNSQPLAAGLTAPRPPGDETVAPDVTRDAKASPPQSGRSCSPSCARGAPAVTPPPSRRSTRFHLSSPKGAWTAERLRSALENYRVDHEGVRLDPEARNIRHTHVLATEDGRTWRVEQVLVDAEQHNDWMVECAVDLQASREANRPVLWLRGIRPIG